MKKMMGALVALGLGVAALVYFLSDGPDFTPHAQESAGALPSSSPAREPLRPVESPLAAATAPPETVESVPESPAPRVLEPEQSGIVRLRGRLVGLDPDDARPPSIVISGVPVDPDDDTTTVVGALDEGGEPGAFTADVTALVTAARELLDLEVRADHPGYLVARSRTRVVPGATEYRCDVRLVRSGSASGRVVDEAGSPVAGATVGAFAREGDGLSRERLDLAVTAADGTFRVRALRGTSAAVIAASGSLLPAAASFEFVPGSDVPLGDLGLRPGEAIEGRVTLADGAPLPGATVAALRANDGGASVGLGSGAGVVFSANGSVERTRGTAVTDESGRYRIGGLDRGEHSVAVEDVPLEFMCLQQGLEDRREFAPASGVDFVLDGATLIVEVHSRGVPVEKPSIMVSTPQTMLNARGDAGGRLTIRTVPEAQHRMFVYHATHESVRVSVTSPQAGETHVESVELEPRRPRGAVRVVLRSTDGATIDRAALLLHVAGGSHGPIASADARLEDGAFRIADVEPGSYRLVVHAGGSLQRRGDYLDGEVSVEVPESGEAEVSLVVRPAGRLRVAARDEDGRMLPASAVLRAAGGVARPLRFKSVDPGMSRMAEKLFGEWPLEPEETFAPGRYEIEFACDGYRVRVETVHVAAHRATDVDVTLDRL